MKKKLDILFFLFYIEINLEFLGTCRLEVQCIYYFKNNLHVKNNLGSPLASKGSGTQNRTFGYLESALKWA